MPPPQKKKKKKCIITFIITLWVLCVWLCHSPQHFIIFSFYCVLYLEIHKIQIEIGIGNSQYSMKVTTFNGPISILSTHSLFYLERFVINNNSNLIISVIKLTHYHSLLWCCKASNVCLFVRDNHARSVYQYQCLDGQTRLFITTELKIKDKIWIICL